MRKALCKRSAPIPGCVEPCVTIHLNRHLFSDIRAFIRSRLPRSSLEQFPLNFLPSGMDSESGPRLAKEMK